MNIKKKQINKYKKVVKFVLFTLLCVFVHYFQFYEILFIYNKLLIVIQIPIIIIKTRRYLIFPIKQFVFVFEKKMYI